MYKIITPNGVWYITRKVLVSVLDTGESRAYVLKPGEFYQRMRWAIFPIDKVVEPERKMFWIAFNNVLRGMGICK
jgi:hypothetical protein